MTKVELRSDFNSQKITHSLPIKACYGLSTVNILEKTDSVRMEPHIICPIFYIMSYPKRYDVPYVKFSLL